MTHLNDLRPRRRERLAAAGVREIVEMNTASEEERAMEFGLCPLCRGVLTTYQKFGLDDYDHLYAEYGMTCTGCGAT